jgi:hypothetical protein
MTNLIILADHLYLPTSIFGNRNPVIDQPKANEDLFEYEDGNCMPLGLHRAVNFYCLFQRQPLPWIVKLQSIKPTNLSEQILVIPLSDQLEPIKFNLNQL